MKTVNFKKGIELLGYQIIKYTKGYNYRSAFAIDKDGNMFYFNIEDLRDDEPYIMYRTAQHERDYTGGTNQWNFKERLERLGYKVVEPRKKCDYNSL